MGKGYLILGEIEDYITGKTIKDTHDERYRQKLARILVDDKDYQKNEIKTNYKLPVNVEDKTYDINIDFIVTLSDKICMIIKYGPGSIVTRIRPALAASRLVTGYQVPVIVVTNGEDAEIVDGLTGDSFLHGIESIPLKSRLLDIVKHYNFKPVSTKHAVVESRILYAFEIEGSCSL
jgi:hypothetical protein